MMTPQILVPGEVESSQWMRDNHLIVATVECATPLNYGSS